MKTLEEISVEQNVPLNTIQQALHWARLYNISSVPSVKTISKRRHYYDETEVIDFLTRFNILKQSSCQEKENVKKAIQLDKETQSELKP